METLLLTVAMTILILLLLAFIVVYGRFVERHQPKSETAKTPLPSSQPHARASITDMIMSILLGAVGPSEGVAEPLPDVATEAGQPIAKGGNAVNDALPGNAVASILDNPSPDITEARELIRYQAKIEALADLVNAGKVPQAEGIEIVFHCKRSGRPESPYARARAAVQAALGPAKVVYYDELREKITAEQAQ